MCLTMPSNTSTATSNPDGAMSAPGSSRPPASSSIPPEETEAGSDEVKVFADEDEREENVNEKYHQVDILSAIKSSLITETEQKTSDHRHAFPAPDKFFDPAVQAYMAPYLMNTYAAAAYAASANSSLVRSPFLYGDPLGSPPPAHGAPVGFRPPIYSLPHAQYPYSMLGGAAEHLAAWHHQASMYQQNALRAASPYSLQITSQGLTSPMSRFSPGGLLGHHPGLSPGLGGHPGQHPHHHHLPHVKSEPGHYDRKHSEKESSPSKNKKDHIKKPLNAFMLYMKEMRPVVQAECTLKESAAINQILGRRWHSLSREEQAKYYEKARQERQKHLQMYPHWNARDNYRYGLKKKKRKRDKSDDPAASMKKCRARYGLDQQDLWCRPCRRKKKCIRVQAYLDGKMSENGVTNSVSGSIGGPGTLANSGSDGSDNSRMLINNNRPDGGKPRNGMMHSDDESDDEEEDDEDDNSPTSHQGRNSVESTSEQSLTSPAGFSSIPSLGSPAGSVASPSTPGTYENSSGGNFNSVVTSGGNLLGGVDPGFWYSRPSGAFKPPTTNSGCSIYPPGSLQHAQQLHALHHYHQQLAGLHRPPVGTDPRDSKNPLSISQLTGNHCSTSSHHPANQTVAAGAASDSKRTLLGMT